MARASALAALAAAAVCAAPASAQSLQRLTVSAFTLTADSATPKIEVPFALIVTVHVRERVASLENLDLPVLAELELLGDERHLTSDRSGTTYREVIDVVAHHSGDIHVAPATIDALDPRDNRGKRYFSNDLTIHVTGGAPQLTRGAVNVLSMIFAVLAWCVPIIALIFLAAVFLRGRKRVTPEPQAQPVSEPAAAPPQRDPMDLLRDALLTLRAERSRSCVLAVRTLARNIVGADDTQTLADVLRRPAAFDPRMRDVLCALERAAFTYDSDLRAATEGAIASLEHATEHATI